MFDITPNLIPPDPTPPGGPTPIDGTITPTRISGMTAPAGVMFEADAISPAASVVMPYFDCHYRWDFGATVGATVLQNLPSDMPWGTNVRYAYGPVVMAVFPAGVHTVELQINDGVNNPKTLSIIITVTDPDTVFAGGNTAVIGGNFVGKPSGADEFATFAEAYAAKSGNQNQRYLLRNGETHQAPVISASCDRLCIGTFGAGPEAIVTNTLLISSAVNPQETIIEGLDIRGAYDPTQASPAEASQQGIDLGQWERLSGFKTIARCKISGVNSGIVGVGNSVNPASHIYLFDLSVSSWGDYGLFIPDMAYVGMTACFIGQPKNTVNGAGKNTAPFWADHGPYRTSRQYGPVCASLCDWKSFNDWSGDTNNRSMQPTFRCNTGQLDQKLNLDRIRSEGGPLNTFNQTSSAVNRPMYALLDKAHIILTSHPTYGLTFQRGGTTMRNVIAVVPNSAPGVSTGLRNMAWMGDPGNNLDGNLDRRIELYSSTFADLRSDANARSRFGNQDRDYSRVGGSGFADAYVGNVVDYAPNMATGGASPAAALDAASKWSTAYEGERWETVTPDASRAYGDEVSADFQPASAIPATGKSAFDDFYGTPRGASPSQGAVEPA